MLIYAFLLLAALLLGFLDFLFWTETVQPNDQRSRTGKDARHWSLHEWKCLTVKQWLLVIWFSVIPSGIRRSDLLNWERNFKQRCSHILILPARASRFANVLIWIFILRRCWFHYFILEIMKAFQFETYYYDGAEIKMSQQCLVSHVKNYGERETPQIHRV